MATYTAASVPQAGVDIRGMVHTMAVGTPVSSVFEVEALADDRVPVPERTPVPCEECRVVETQSFASITNSFGESALLVWSAHGEAELRPARHAVKTLFSI